MDCIVNPLLKSVIARVGFANFSFVHIKRRKSRSFGGRYSGKMAEGQWTRKGERGKLRAGLLPLPRQKGEKAGGESAAGVHTQRNWKGIPRPLAPPLRNASSFVSVRVFRDWIYMHVYAFSWSWDKSTDKMRLYVCRVKLQSSRETKDKSKEELYTEL